MRLPFYPIVLIPLTHELSKSKSFCLTDYETILYCICFYPYASINTVAPKSGPCVEHQIGSQGVYWDYKVTNSPKFKQASSRLLPGLAVSDLEKHRSTAFRQTGATHTRPLRRGLVLVCTVPVWMNPVLPLGLLV